MVSNFDLVNLKELLHNFYTLTRIRIVIFDDNFNQIISYPSKHSTYCTLIRADARSAEQCFLGDQRACLMCKSTNELFTYECHAGLTETVAPIKYNKIVIGYIMFGQILQHKDKDEVWTKTEKSLSQYTIDMKALKTSFYKKRYFSEEIIYAASKIMEICSNHLIISRMAMLQEDSLPNKIDTYIREHLPEPLSIDSIKEYFSISKTRLYQICEHSYGMGIAQYIRKLRIQMAEDMLLNTNTSIKQIAESVGIYDYNYFTKIFKKELDITPKEYRKQRKLLNLHALGTQ